MVISIRTITIGCILVATFVFVKEVTNDYYYYKVDIIQRKQFIVVNDNDSTNDDSNNTKNNSHYRQTDKSTDDDDDDDSTTNGINSVITTDDSKNNLNNQQNTTTTITNTILSVTDQKPQQELYNDKSQLMQFPRNQPHWAYKLDFMERAEEISDSKRICFVHVGKTAGSTLMCFLGFHSDHCANGLNETTSNHIPRTSDIDKATNELKSIIPNGYLPHYTTSQMHLSYDSCHETPNIHMYLFVVRNPFSRIKSWFEYERINQNNTSSSSSRKKTSYINKKKLYIDCQFQTLNQLGGINGLGSKKETTCSRRAYRAIAGTTGYSKHNKYNYGYYYNKVLSLQNQNKQQNQNDNQQQSSKIIVIRTEHLEYDWSIIETNILNGPALPNNFTFIHKNQSPKNPDDMIMDILSKRNICNVLCEEIQIYKQILKQSVNINNDQYIQSMNELSIDCPKEVITTTCPYFRWKYNM